MRFTCVRMELYLIGGKVKTIKRIVINVYHTYMVRQRKINYKHKVSLHMY